MSGAEIAQGPRGGSGEMFDQIAARYDLLNRLISFGLDRSWRRRLVAALRCDGRAARVLDVATGTADVALDIARLLPQAEVVGLDPSRGMLDVGDQKIARRGLEGRVRLVVGDAQAMGDFADDSFDAACISFGIRNVPDRVQGLREMGRVTRPGGKVCVLELSEPQGGGLAPFARFHVHHVVPALGSLLSGSREYRYLQRSIAAFPPPEVFAGLMREAGLVDVQVERMRFGAAHLYVGTAE
jgi:demethylmenaquinone methyltransferase/2-methoxy-6-polyprenyl-1,4-benzoquinol methylase